MLAPFLTQALLQLDAWLIEVCAREEARAKRLAAGSAAGWSAVQAMARPAAASLAFDDAPPPELLAAGDHPFAAVRAAFQLSAVEAEALLVLLAPYIEPRYRALYGVLQDNLQQTWTTEQLVLAVLGRAPERRRTLLASLADDGRLTGAGLVLTQPGVHAPLGRGP